MSVTSIYCIWQQYDYFKLELDTVPLEHVVECTDSVSLYMWFITCYSKDHMNISFSLVFFTCCWFQRFNMVYHRSSSSHYQKLTALCLFFSLFETIKLAIS